jgi:hypothetical protein
MSIPSNNGPIISPKIHIRMLRVWFLDCFYRVAIPFQNHCCGWTDAGTVSARPVSIPPNNGPIISSDSAQWPCDRRLLGDVGLRRKISRAGLRLRFSRPPCGPQDLEASVAISGPGIAQKFQRLAGWLASRSGLAFPQPEGFENPG